MTIEHMIAFNVTLIAAILSPGPAFLVAVQTTLQSGRRAGIAIGCGLGLMAAAWTLMALLGLDAIFRLVPWAYLGAKIAGALYLLYIAWGMWRGARDRIEARVKPARHAFRQGILINILNPKSVLFAAAVLIVIFPAARTPFENALITLNHLAVEIAFYTLLAMAMSSRLISDKYLKAKLYLDRTASLILGALGLKLLVGR